MARLPTKTEKRYMKICDCERAGLSYIQTNERLLRLEGFSISEHVWKRALEWQSNQISVRLEIESLYRAYLQVQELKRAAISFLIDQQEAIGKDPEKINIRSIERLIDKELEYANKIRELTGQLVSGEGQDDFGDTYDWLSEIETDGTGKPSDTG